MLAKLDPKADRIRIDTSQPDRYALLLHQGAKAAEVLVKSNKEAERVRAKGMEKVRSQWKFSAMGDHVICKRKAIPSAPSKTFEDVTDLFGILDTWTLHKGNGLRLIFPNLQLDDEDRDNLIEWLDDKKHEFSEQGLIIFNAAGI